MRFRSLVSAVFYFCDAALAQDHSLTVTGTLVRSMAVGGESTGWTIELEPKIVFDGKQADAIEVTYDPVSRVECVTEPKVKASGTVPYRNGVETGRRRVLRPDRPKQSAW